MTAPGPRTRRLWAVLTAVCATAALVGLGAADRWAPLAAVPTPEPPTQEASPSFLVLACPPGILDPASTDTQGAPAGMWTSAGAEDARAATPTLASTSGGGRLEVPTGIVVAGQGGGELRGLALTPCTAARGDQWVAAGSTRVGEDLVLVLANPAAQASVVTLTTLGASGVDGDPQTVTVPGGARVAVLPATWSPDQERPAVHVVADGPGVAAWAQSSGLDGEVPTGMTWAGATRAGTRLVLPGVSAGDGAVLRLAVPGQRAAHVRVSVSGASGTAVLGGAEDVEVDAGTTLDLDLAGIPADPSALVVDSDVPVVAQATVHGQGASWPTGADTAAGAGGTAGGGSRTWTARTSVGTAQELTRADLPGALALRALADAQLGATPLRPTTVTTSSGGSVTRVRLVVTDAGAPGEARRTRVTVAGRSLDVPAGATVVEDLPDSPGALEADGPVRAAVLVQADTPAGVVTAVWAVGTAGVPSGSARVDVEP